MRSLQERFRFHLEHGGWCEPPGRAACALRAAKDETLLERAVDAGVAVVEWCDDDMPWGEGTEISADDAARKFSSGEWTGPYGCVVTVNGDHVASLWGIVVGPAGTNDPYCRVVAADLAGEARDDLLQALSDESETLEVCEALR